MGLSCSCENDDADWWYEPSDDFSLLATKRSRKCCSCSTKVKPGDEVLKLRRWRSPKYDIEESIYGDEVPLSTWFMCERCGGLYFAVQDLGMCCDIEENIIKQIKEFREMESSYFISERNKT